MALLNVELRKHIVANAVIRNLVGPRVFSDELPPAAAAMPALVYLQIDGQSTDQLSGISDHARARLQIDAYSDTRAQSVQLADYVRLLLEGHRGMMEGIWVSGIELDSGMRYHTSLDPRETGQSKTNDRRLFVTSQDFGFHYQPATTF